MKYKTKSAHLECYTAAPRAWEVAASCCQMVCGQTSCTGAFILTHKQHTKQRMNLALPCARYSSNCSLIYHPFKRWLKPCRAGPVHQLAHRTDLLSFHITAIVNMDRLVSFTFWHHFQITNKAHDPHWHPSLPLHLHYINVSLGHPTL